MQREASNFVMRPMPQVPALMALQLAAFPFPTGVTMPMPVMTIFFILPFLSYYKYGHCMYVPA